MSHTCEWCKQEYGIPDVPSQRHNIEECRAILEAKVRYLDLQIEELKKAHAFEVTVAQEFIDQNTELNRLKDEAERKGRDLCQQNGDMLLLLHEVHQVLCSICAEPKNAKWFDHHSGTYQNPNGIHAIKEKVLKFITVPNESEKRKCPSCFHEDVNLGNCLPESRKDGGLTWEELHCQPCCTDKENWKPAEQTKRGTAPWKDDDGKCGNPDCECG